MFHFKSMLHRSNIKMHLLHSGFALLSDEKYLLTVT